MKPILIFPVVLGAILCLAVGGCSKDREKPTADGTKPATAAPQAAGSVGDNAAAKACSLVTKEEVQQILGIPVVGLTATESSCSYRTAPDMGVDIDTVWKGGKKEMDAARALTPALFEPISGLGDEAYFHGAGILHVRKGGVYIVINSRPYLNTKDTETRIARKALANLR